MSTQGSVKQDKSGRWCFVVDAPSPDGKRHQLRRRGFKTKKDAQAELTKVLGEVQRGTFVTPVNLTVRAYLEQWVSSLPGQGRRYSTVDSYSKMLIRHVYPSVGAIELQQLRAIDLDGLYARLAEPVEGRPLSKRSIRLVHTVIGKALADAERKGLVQRNAARLASPPSAASTRAPEMQVWTPAQLNTFLASVDGSSHTAMLRTAALTGLRRGELCGLRWAAVDLDAGRLTVNRTLLAVHGRLVESEPKTARSRRVVDLDPATAATIRDHRRRQREERLEMGVGYQDDGYVFARPDGRPWNPEYVSRVFDRLVAASGLARIRLHDLRHTHTTHLLAAGVNVRIVSERLGHASVAFTLDVYGHVLPGQQASAAAAVAGLVDGL
jgi:integrase